MSAIRAFLASNLIYKDGDNKSMIYWFIIVGRAQWPAQRCSLHWWHGGTQTLNPTPFSIPALWCGWVKKSPMTCVRPGCSSWSRALFCQDFQVWTAWRGLGLLHRLFSRQYHCSEFPTGGGEMSSGRSREVAPPVLQWQTISVQSPPANYPY